MRLSGIKNVLGGADNVSVVEVIQGSQLVWHGAFTEPNPAYADWQELDEPRPDPPDEDVPVNINEFVLTAIPKYYTATIRSGRGGALAIAPGSFVEVDPPAGAPTELRIVKVPEEMGAFTFTFPHDIYTDPILPDITEEVPIVVVFFRYIGGIDGTTAPIMMHRLLAIMRSGVVA